MSTITKTMKPGDVVSIGDELFIYQGPLPQGGGNPILQFSNKNETRGMTLDDFLKQWGRVLPAEIAPETVKNGLIYEFK